MNEDLVEAIALGHDLGHTPFGHAGERALNKICPRFAPASGIHAEHRIRAKIFFLPLLQTFPYIHQNCLPFNLTYEVRDGILNHQTSGMPVTLEGRVVRFSDKIAYIHHDMDDAIRGGILKETG